MMTHKERLTTTLRGGKPDRIPCWPKMTRWVRYHERCPCPRHQVKTADDFDLDAIVFYPSYIWQSLSNDYVYAPGGGYISNANGLYGDLPGVNVNISIENKKDIAVFKRSFNTPAGVLRDVIEWAKPNAGYGDGPNPHRVEPLVKTTADLEKLEFLHPPPREDLLADLPLLLQDVGERALVAAIDTTHAGSWGMEVLGPESMLEASLTDPDLLAGVCRISQKIHLRNLKALLERGLILVYDSWFQCGPSVGWQPHVFADVFLPLIVETVELVHAYDALFVYQDDGKMKDIIPSLVSAGVDVVAGLQPLPIGDADLASIKKEFGDSVVLCGGLDPVYVFDRGSPAHVEEAVRQAIIDAGDGGRFILSTAEAISPETSEQCIRAAVDTVKRYGVYGRDRA